MSTFFHDGDPGCTRSNWLGCDPNGGCNSSDVNSFKPTNLDVENWVQSFQALGLTSAVLTAKHGCGFLAWKTNTTLPDGTPYRYHVPDIYPVAQLFAAACEAAGIGHGRVHTQNPDRHLRYAPYPHLTFCAASMGLVLW